MCLSLVMAPLLWVTPPAPAPAPAPNTVDLTVTVDGDEQWVSPLLHQTVSAELIQFNIAAAEHARAQLHLHVSPLDENAGPNFALIFRVYDADGHQIGLSQPYACIRCVGSTLVKRTKESLPLVIPLLHVAFIPPIELPSMLAYEPPPISWKAGLAVTGTGIATSILGAILWSIPNPNGSTVTTQPAAIGWGKGLVGSGIAMTTIGVGIIAVAAELARRRRNRSRRKWVNRRSLRPRSLSPRNHIFAPPTAQI